MSTFNLKYLIDKNGLNEDALAKELFPNNKFPRVALNRILDGIAYLDTAQLEVLARICNLQIQELFSSESWSTKMEGNKIIFIKNNFSAVLDLDTLVTEIYNRDRIVADEVVIVEKSIKLSDYLKIIDGVIINLI